MNGPSPHLSWSELACKNGVPYPAEWRTTRAAVLAAEFERIRAAVGKPITILSAYRTPAYNARISGAAKNSQHVQGRALDLKPPAGMTLSQFLKIVLAVARADGSKIRGVGEYAWGVHIDIRPADRLVRWSGSKPVQVA